MPPTITSSGNLAKNPLMTPKELRETLNVSRLLLKRLIDEHGLPVIQIGNTMRFERFAVQAWIAKHYVNAPRKKNGKMQEVSSLEPGFIQEGDVLAVEPEENVLAAQSAD